MQGSKAEGLCKVGVGTPLCILAAICDAEYKAPNSPLLEQDVETVILRIEDGLYFKKSHIGSAVHDVFEDTEKIIG